MPITQIDHKSALVVIDLQRGIVARSPQAPATISNTVRLVEAYRSHNLPVVLVNVAGPAAGRTDTPRPDFSQLPADFTQLIPELNVQPSDILITKSSFGALVSTGLHEKLQALGVTQIVLTGIATSIGVESTARSAYDFHYNVAFVTDAMSDLRPESHEASIHGIFPRLGQLDTTDNVLKLLGK